MNAIVQIALAGADDALQLAEDHLGELLAALLEVDIESARLCPYMVAGFIASVRQYRRLLGKPRLVGERLAWYARSARRYVEEREPDYRDPAGLEKSAIALGFAAANFDEATEALEDARAKRLHEAVYAAATAFDLMANVLEGAMARRRAGEPSLN